MAKPIDLEKIIQEAEKKAEQNPELAGESKEPNSNLLKGMVEVIRTLTPTDDSNYDQKIKELKEKAQKESK